MTQVCSNCQKTCDRFRKGLCNTCYTKDRKFGDPGYCLAAYPKTLSEQQNNLIVGSMLGDGHIRRQKSHWNSMFYIKRCQKDLAYLEWEANIVKDIITETGIRKRDQYDTRTNKTYYSCELITRALITLNKFHDEWYHNRIKVVPNDLKLNAEIIAIWFCDDGTIGTGSSNNRLRVSFATNSFSKDEVYFLKDLLDDRYNENFTTSCRHDTEKEQYIIHGSDSAARTMIADIDPVFPIGMQRKRLWDKPESCFYQDAPIRRRSHEESSRERKAMVNDFICCHDEFYLADLTRYLDWSFTRSDGRIEWDIQGAKRYLKSYVEDGVLLEMPRDANEYRKGILFKKIRPQ